MDNQNFYPPQQNWNQPVPPEKPKSGWVKWVIIGVACVCLFSVLLIFIYGLGKKFGHTINDISQNKLSQVDSMQLNSIQEDFDSVYAMLARDSSSSASAAKIEIDALRERSDSIIEMFNTNQQDFNDSIRDAGTISRLTQFLSKNYFLKTGRATKMKNRLLAYRENSIQGLNPLEQDSALRMNIPIDDGQKLLPSYLSKFTGWENLYFNQPVMNVNLNFRILRTQVRNFEQEILKRQRMFISSAMNDGPVIIDPNGDTVK